MCLLSCFSRVQFFATLWTAVHQAPLPLGFSRQEYWSGLPCPSPGVHANPGIEYMSPATPALQADSLPLSHRGSPNMEHNGYPILSSEVTSGYNPQDFIGDAVLQTIVAQFFKTKFKLGPVLDLKLWFPQGQYRFNQFDNFYH